MIKIKLFDLKLTATQKLNHAIDDEIENKSNSLTSKDFEEENKKYNFFLDNIYKYEKDFKIIDNLKGEINLEIKNKDSKAIATKLNKLKDDSYLFEGEILEEKYIELLDVTNPNNEEDASLNSICENDKNKNKIRLYFSIFDQSYIFDKKFENKKISGDFVFFRDDIIKEKVTDISILKIKNCLDVHLFNLKKSIQIEDSNKYEGLYKKLSQTKEEFLVYFEKKAHLFKNSINAINLKLKFNTFQIYEYGDYKVFELIKVFDEIYSLSKIHCSKNDDKNCILFMISQIFIIFSNVFINRILPNFSTLQYLLFSECLNSKEDENRIINLKNQIDDIFSKNFSFGYIFSLIINQINQTSNLGNFKKNSK